MHFSKLFPVVGLPPPRTVALLFARFFFPVRGRLAGFGGRKCSPLFRLHYGEFSAGLLYVVLIVVRGVNNSLLGGRIFKNKSGPVVCKRDTKKYEGTQPNMHSSSLITNTHKT